MIKPKIVFVCFFFINVNLIGQTNVIQDGDGETSFLLLSKNSFIINAAKTSIGFSISPKQFDNTQNLNYWTITSSANAKKGTSNLFKGGEFQFSGKLGGNRVFDLTDYGDRNNPGSGNFTYAFIGLEGLYSRHNVIDTAKAKSFDDQISDQTNIGFRVNAGLNLQNVAFDNLGFLGAFTLGVSVSGGLKDNTDVLDQVEVITNTFSVSNGTTTRTISNTTEAFEKNKLSEEDLFSRINLDFGKQFFNHRLYANFHFTYAFDENIEPALNPAIGLFVTEDNAPLEAIVGIQIQTSDWSNNRNSEKSRWERTSLVLTAGFPFN